MQMYNEEQPAAQRKRYVTKGIIQMYIALCRATSKHASTRYAKVAIGGNKIGLFGVLEKKRKENAVSQSGI